MQQPRPIAAAFTRRPFQMVFIVMGIATTNAAFSNWVVVSDVCGHYSSRLRFTVLEQRGQDPRLTLFNVGSFGVMQDGIDVQRNATVVKSGPSLTVSFSEPTAWSQFYFETGGETQYDPVRFTLEEWQPPGVSEDAMETCERDQNSRWQMVGSSSHLTYHVTRTLFHGRFPTRMERGVREVFDQRFALGCFVQAVSLFILPGLFCIVSAIAGAFGMEQVGQVLIPLTPLISAITTGFTCAWCILYPSSRGRNWNAWFHAVNCLSYLVSWNLLRFNQVTKYFAWLGAFWLVVALGLDYCSAPLDFVGPSSLTSIGYLAGGVLFGLAVVIKVSQVLAVTWAHAQVAPYCRLY